MIVKLVYLGISIGDSPKLNSDFVFESTVFVHLSSYLVGQNCFHN